MTTRKTPTLLIGGLCLCLAAPTLAADLPTAEEVFARYTAAIGGDAVAEVKNATMDFAFSMPAMGVDTTGRFLLEAPDRSYTMISLAAMGAGEWEDGVNGDVAWQNNPQMGYRVLEGLEKTLALQKTRLDSFAGWEELWKSAETVGEETLGETACFKVVLTSSEGEAVSLYFDKETGLIIQQDIPLAQMGATVIVKMSDYREVDGVTYAYRIDQEGPMAAIIEFTDVRFNVDDIPADAFELPEAIKDMVAQ